MYEYDENIVELYIPDEFSLVQQTLNAFVKVNYETARNVEINIKTLPEYIANLRGKILDIIRSNPPLASVPKYFRDGREDYLWYSDFFDETSKDVYRKYKAFIKPDCQITITNYAKELSKIDLPYFKELVNLVSLERLCMDYEKKLPKEVKEVKQSVSLLLPEDQSTVAKTEPESTIKPKLNRKQQQSKRSYEPKLTDKQYALLSKCIETMQLFRRPIKVTELKKLLKGKLTEPLQVTNQKSLVYLFDLLKENKYIKDTWMSVADGNKDFISFRSEGNKQRYGDEIHYIPMQHLVNDRKRNVSQFILKLDDIDETIEQLNKIREK